MHDTYRADVARSKEIGDYYRDLSVNYALYEEWNKTPVALRDWENPLYWPIHPHPEAMGYLAVYFDNPNKPY
jgi:hypothetical protein